MSSDFERLLTLSAHSSLIELAVERKGSSGKELDQFRPGYWQDMIMGRMRLYRSRVTEQEKPIYRMQVATDIKMFLIVEKAVNDQKEAIYDEVKEIYDSGTPEENKELIEYMEDIVLQKEPNIKLYEQIKIHPCWHEHDDFTEAEFEALRQDLFKQLEILELEAIRTGRI